MITLRLDAELEQSINSMARRMGVTKSELIRKSITNFIEAVEHPSPWELGSKLFGRHASGQDNLSRDRKSIIKEQIRAKR
ncbi:MAG: ribbon-helix-helix domain-containing protein [Candidatus Thiodiazotropha sp. (ex Troendleina suluensis)]|nr:ribbon-helix-helix domain-containing protein [Candidatus Thiodiazotropha sp. (ex Troendleina suluensis)]